MRLAVVSLASLGLASALVIPREPTPGGKKKGQDFEIHQDANAKIMSQYHHEKPPHDPYTLQTLGKSSNMLNLANAGQGNHGAHQGGRENRPPQGGRKRSPGGKKKGQDFEIHQDANAKIMSQYHHEKPPHDPYTLQTLGKSSNMLNLANAGQGNHGAHQGGRENRPPQGGRKRSADV